MPFIFDGPTFEDQVKRLDLDLLYSISNIFDKYGLQDHDCLAAYVERRVFFDDGASLLPQGKLVKVNSRGEYPIFK
jgi:hypothetical protein